MFVLLPECVQQIQRGESQSHVTNHDYRFGVTRGRDSSRREQILNSWNQQAAARGRGFGSSSLSALSFTSESMYTYFEHIYLNNHLANYIPGHFLRAIQRTMGWRCTGDLGHQFFA